MRLAVMGAGAVGGYFGSLLARSGNGVTLIARGAHLESIRAGGLRVRSQGGDFTVKVDATDYPADVGHVDLVIFSVKTYQNAAAIPAMMPLVSEDTSILTLQNGVEAHAELARAAGPGRVLPGAAYIETQVEAPGVIRQVGDVVRVVFGEVGGERTSRSERVLDTFVKAGIRTELSSDVVKELWTKFLFISTLAGVTSAARASLSQLLQHEEARETVLASMREAEAVGRARGVNLDPDVVDSTMRYMETSAKDLHASMHTDLELGRPLELEALNGAVVRLGREVRVATPVNQPPVRDPGGPLRMGTGAPRTDRTSSCLPPDLVVLIVALPRVPMSPRFV